MIKKLLNSTWFYYAAAAVLVIGYFATQVEIQLPARSHGELEDIRTLAERDDLNVLFIVIDTLRADHLGSYGYERDTSPTIDRLAETGIRFHNHVAQSTWTKTSMASLWTGTYPVTNEVLRFDHAIPEEATLPAELFKAAGYRTAGIFRNGWVGHEFGFDQGFDQYLKPAVARTDAALERFRKAPHQLLGSDWDLTTNAVEFLRLYGQEKFFLYVHYMDLHQYAYEEGSALFGTGYMDAYDNAIHWTDRNINKLVGSLEEQGLAENTVVVIASDHGEAFGEHGKEGHAKDVYREVIGTPFVIVLPWFLDEPVVVDAVTENVDLWPTILDIVGIEPVDESDGRSLVPLILGGEDPKPGPAFAHLERNWANSKPPNPVVAVRDGDSKLVYWEHWKPLRVELYDLADDPAEEIRIDGEEPEETGRLLAEARAYHERSPASWGAAPESVEIDEFKRGILQALGYVLEDE